jgi:hypothetical protein
MIRRGIIASMAILLASGMVFMSCDTISENRGLEESMEIVPNLKLVNGADNVTMKVNRGEAKNSYFSVELNNVGKNSVINNGVQEAWCIVYDKPLDSNGGVYDGVKLYNTFGDKSFKPLNHFLNERYDLRRQYSQLTWREEQVIIWSVMDKHNPFDVEKVDITRLTRLHSNGQPLFDKDLVKEILTKLEREVDSFEYKTGQVYAIAGDNGADDQTIIFIGETMFAFGGAEGSFRCALDMPRWGWVIEFDGENLIYEGNEAPLNQTPFIAGAGGEKCDPYDPKGEVVGNLTVAYSDGYIDFTYKADGDYVFSDPHVWVGCAAQEVADLGGNPPANFYGLGDLSGHTLSSSDYFSEQTFSLDVSGLTCDGNYFIAVHAGNDEPED